MKIRNKLLILNATSILFYAPNYLSLVLPIVKAIPIVAILVSVVFLVKQQSLKLSNEIYFFSLIPIIVLVLGLINGLRFDNFDSVNFGITFFLKYIHILIVYLLITSQKELFSFSKYLIIGISMIAIHTILQFFLNMFSIVGEQGRIITQGYEYINLGFFGFYRVGFGFEGLNFIRAQSFFQEPAFLAFYFIFGFVMINFLENYEYKIKFQSTLKILLSLATFLTFSFTGIVLLIFIYIFFEKNIFARIVFSIIGIFLVLFILTSDNDYVNKMGSFLLRFEDFQEIFEVFMHPLNYLIGIGYNNESFYINAKANNFLIELFLHGSIFSIIVFIIFTISFYSKNINTKGLTLLYAFVLTVPLFWSPIISLMIILIDKLNFIKRQERKYFTNENNL